MRVKRLALVLLVVPVLGALGCAESFPLPMTAAELVSYGSGEALVAYLGQPDASPSVCDLRARGPHLYALDEETRHALVGGLTDGTIDPARWRRCADAFLRSAPEDDAASLIDAVGVGYRALLRDSDFEASSALQGRLRVMQALYIDRKIGSGGHPELDARLFSELRRALAAHRLGPAATRFGEELLATVDLEHDRFRGQPVEVATIDALFSAGDEVTLRRFARRLASRALRDQARRRVIRLHIAASPFPEVRAEARAVEERVMRAGVYALSLVEHPPLRGWLDTRKVPMRGVLVRQQVWQKTATLFGYAGDRPGLSVLPELALRGALEVEVGAISRPVTVCGRPEELDPTPCIAVRDLRLENPAAYLDQDGNFHFVDHIAIEDAVKLARLHRFVLPISVGKKRLLAFEWLLYYERPESLIFNGRSPGWRGPNLGVGVDHRDPERFIFTVSGAGGPFFAVVEKPDLAAFQVVSRGGMGFAGATGATGSSGSDGSECSSGGPGGDGGPGGPGGPGGDGGDLLVELACGSHSCSDAVAVLERNIFSAAGPGGPGGQGGAGGSGGSGGSSRAQTTHIDSDGNTVVDDPGCSAGSSGSSGAQGPNGMPGPPGHPGRTRFTLDR